MKDLKKNIKKAIVSDGMHSAYIRQMLDTWFSRNRITQNDWTQLVSAVLECGSQLQRKSWLREETFEQQDKIRGF